MSQVIYYHGFQNIFVLYRGGKETDGYGYGECPFGRKEITEGFLMHVDDPLALMKMLHIPNDGQDHKREVNFSVCFGSDGSIYFYDERTKNKGRIQKTFTRNSSLLKRYRSKYDFALKSEFPLTYDFWDIKGDFVRCSANYTQLSHLIPEIILDKKEFREPYNKYPLDFKSLNKLLYNLNPIDLNDSWDYTDEIKEEMRIGRERAYQAQLKREQELQERKNTPGYCSRCGCEHADLVANPFDEEINGIINMEWLCRDCYNDICGDI